MRYLFVWIVVGIILAAGTLYWGSRNIIVCWDGIDVNEPLLIEQCGITKQEYFSGIYEDADSCAEESGAVQYIGSCDPDWEEIREQTARVGAGYLAFSALLFGAWRLLRRR